MFCLNLHVSSKKKKKTKAAHLWTLANITWTKLQGEELHFLCIPQLSCARQLQTTGDTVFLYCDLAFTSISSLKTCHWGTVSLSYWDHFVTLAAQDRMQIYNMQSLFRITISTHSTFAFIPHLFRRMSAIMKCSLSPRVFVFLLLLTVNFEHKLLVTKTF